MQFDLDRFIRAQEPIIDGVYAELRAGRKHGHWMWFVFPQLKGLGSSATAEHFGITSLEEAQAYLAHPVLGVRLLDCTGIVNELEDRSLDEIFGYPDDLKFRSCITLFSHAAPGSSAFETALRKYCSGQADTATLELLASG